MKKLFLVGLVTLIYSCSSTKSTMTKPLYEVLSYENDGGANIRFYEILTEPNEIKMLLGDPNLKKKIKSEDIEKSNFIILNMGELPEGNYNITVDKIEETPMEIIVYVKETKPTTVTPNDVENFVRPYSVVKINSKKSIIIK